MKKTFFILSIFTLLLLCGFDTNAGYDVTAPKLNGVTLDKTTIKKPGTLNITLDITEEETGVTELYVSCQKSSGGGSTFTYTSWTIPNAFTGKYTVSAPISSTFRVGDDYIILYVELTDGQGNKSTYRKCDDDELCLRNIDELSQEDDFCYVNHGFAVEEEFDVNFQYYITNPRIISKIQSMGEDEVGMITYNANGHIAGKEIFDAIKGTNKTIVFSNDSTQWVFKGKDIINDTKDIDLLTSTSVENGADYDNKKDVLKIDFADNGVLPGKARIRMKSDYLYTLHQLTDSLLLYYFDDENSELDKTNSDVNYILDGTDHWCQFYVRHNSSYIVSSKKAKYKPKRGTFVNHKKTNARYMVITAGKNNRTVCYINSTKKKAKTITIPAAITINGIKYKVTRIGDHAFKNNKTVTKIVVGKNITYIGSEAFSGCSSLKTCTMGPDLSQIRAKVFCNCTKLTRITIPSKTSYIIHNAFSGCKNLKTITIQSKKLKFVGVNAFKGIHPKAKIKVPSGKLKKYKRLLKNKGQKSTVKII